jgi:hypothetical protein
MHGVHKTCRLIATPLGYWDQVHGMDHYLKDQKYVRRRNLEGVTFRAGIVVSIYETYKNILQKFRKINQNNNQFPQARQDAIGYADQSRHILFHLLHCIELLLLQFTLNNFKDHFT